MSAAAPADERSMDLELLFCLQALSLGLVDKAVLQEAGRAFNLVAGDEQTLAVTLHADRRKAVLLRVLRRVAEDAVE